MQKCIRRAIGRRLILMLTAVDFYDELLRDADEIDDEWAYRMLTPEFDRAEST